MRPFCEDCPNGTSISPPLRPISLPLPSVSAVTAIQNSRNVSACLYAFSLPMFVSPCLSHLLRLSPSLLPSLSLLCGSASADLPLMSQARVLLQTRANVSNRLPVNWGLISRELTRTYAACSDLCFQVVSERARERESERARERESECVTAVATDSATLINRQPHTCSHTMHTRTQHVHMHL